MNKIEQNRAIKMENKMFESKKKLQKLQRNSFNEKLTIEIANKKKLNAYKEMRNYIFKRMMNQTMIKYFYLYG